MNGETKSGCALIFVVVAAALLLILAVAFGYPLYNVWSSQKKGEAELARAEGNRRIQIEAAKANLESEKLNAQAEIERAKGMAEAMRIENGQLTPTYIQYLWAREVMKLKQDGRDGENTTIIYVPSGNLGLPITEATRLQPPLRFDD